MQLKAATDAADARARFVYIDSGGEPRELTPRECEYLATSFDGADGGRPYIKSSYKSLTPDGISMHGFLERRHLPRQVRIPSPDAPAIRLRRRQMFAKGVGYATSLGSILIACVLGYLGFLVGSLTQWVLLRYAPRPLAIGAFLLVTFFGSAFYFVVGVLRPIFRERPRVFQFLAATTIWIGFLAGSVWVLWFHGEPSRILFTRAMH